MTTALVTIGDEMTTIQVIGIQVIGSGEDGEPTDYRIPRGMVSLHRAHITADPPLPENLTNAIGDMMDHLDDAVRTLTLLGSVTEVVVAGRAAEAIAAVEFGGEITVETFELGRAAAEDVFRTLATEPVDLRRRNPGLPAELGETIPAGCCALVAVLRSLHLDRVTVQLGADQTGPTTAGTRSAGPR